MKLTYNMALRDICDSLGVETEITARGKDEALARTVEAIEDKYTADIKTIRDALKGKQVMTRKDIKELMRYIDSYLL